MSKDKAHGGTILNVGSSCSVKPFLSSPIYTATKHAVLGLTKSFGVSLLFKTVKQILKVTTWR